MKELVFISAQPDQAPFYWQLELFIESVRSLGYQYQIQILFFIPYERISKGPSNKSKELERRYSKHNVSIFWYPDTSNLTNYGIVQADYAPLLRPHILKKHFSKYPDLEQKALFYHDSDIIFTKYLDFTPYLSDQICYLSPTNGYLGLEYFEKKVNQVLPDLRETYQSTDVIDQCAKIIGINRSICEQNDTNVGGAQYILKGIDAAFWQDVEIGSYRLRRYLAYDLGGINARFFRDEDSGIQSWCSDMWALLWNLWKRRIATQTPASLNFCWATDKIANWDKNTIYHDAGVNDTNRSFLFDKRDPLLVLGNLHPFDLNLSYVSDNYCSFNYVQFINQLKTKRYEKSLCAVQ